MKPIKSFSEVKESMDFPKLVPGGYIAKITAVEDKADREYLYIEYDIAEGEFAGHYKALNEKHGFWGGKFIRSYKEKALGMFKSFLIAVDASNGTGFCDKVEKGFDESQLVGKTVGVILGEEKYDKNNGEVGTRLIVAATKPVEDIKAGSFRIPPIKDNTSKDGAASVPGFAELSDTDMPF